VVALGAHDSRTTAKWVKAELAGNRARFRPAKSGATP
jgi:hypothetical protein